MSREVPQIAVNVESVESKSEIILPGLIPGATPYHHTVAAGTSWNAVEGYHKEEDPDSVWQYYFFDPQDSSYNLMMQFLDHEDINIHSWYPWEGSWVGIGFNNGEFCNVYGNMLEQNADGPTGMMSVLGFTAPEKM